MIKNYFGTTIRSLLKRKLYTLINLLDLATGMAVCLLLVLYIQNELGYDEFQERQSGTDKLAIHRSFPPINRSICSFGRKFTVPNRDF